MKNFLIASSLIFFAFGCNQAKRQEVSSKTDTPKGSVETKIGRIKQEIKTVEPFFKRMRKPQPCEWLAHFNETVQTFEEYIRGNPTLPSTERNTIYIQPVGDFNDTQRKVIKLTAEYMEKFFGLPVKLSEEKRLDKNLSREDYRIHSEWKIKQIRTGYFLEKVLKPDSFAAAVIAFTTEDLYPDASMNFLFGEASLQNRVGVWSLYRLNDEKDFKLFLRRTFKIATHETGHMFSMRHCTKYECVMSGTNHLEETDR